MAGFIKVRFSCPRCGSTAGLIFDADEFERSSVEAVSRKFPMSEALKMKVLEASKRYATWEEAFCHKFEGVGLS